MRTLESKVGKWQASCHAVEREVQQNMTNEDALKLFERRNHGLRSNPPANVSSRIKRQEQEIRRNELAIIALQKQIPMLALESTVDKNIYNCPACSEPLTDSDSIYIYGDAPVWCTFCGQALRYKQ